MDRGNFKKGLKLMAVSGAASIAITVLFAVMVFSVFRRVPILAMVTSFACYVWIMWLYMRKQGMFNALPTEDKIPELEATHAMVTDHLKSFCFGHGLRLANRDASLRALLVTCVGEGVTYQIDLDSHDWRFYISRSTGDGGSEETLEAFWRARGKPAYADLAKSTVNLRKPEECVARLKRLLDIAEQSEFFSVAPATPETRLS